MSWTQYLFSFTGRINRAKLWLFLLIVLGVYVVAIVGFIALFGLTGSDRSLSGLGAGILIGGLFALVLGIAIFVASLGLSIRRLHDRDKSGLWLLVFWLLPAFLNGIGTAMSGGFEPGRSPNPIGALFTLVSLGISIWGFVELYCLRGTVGENQYGLDPLNPIGQAKVFE